MNNNKPMSLKDFLAWNENQPEQFQISSVRLKVLRIAERLLERGYFDKVERLKVDRSHYKWFFYNRDECSSIRHDKLSFTALALAIDSLDARYAMEKTLYNMLLQLAGGTKF